MNRTDAYECYDLIKSMVSKPVTTSLVAELESAFATLNVSYVKSAIRLFFDNNGTDFYPSAKSLRHSLYIMKKYAEEKLIEGNNINLRNTARVYEKESNPDKGEPLEPSYELGPWIMVVNELGAYFKSTMSIEEYSAAF